MRWFIIVLFAWLFSCQPAWSKDYLAVFQGMDFYEADWSSYSPDIIWRCSSWKEFPEFVAYVKGNAPKEDRIIIDVQVHGDKYLGICCKEETSRDDRDWDWATMGYVLHNLRDLESRDMKLILEACYGASVYRNTIRGVPKTAGLWTEDYDKVPPYAVFGNVESMVGLNNMVYVQWRHKFRVTAMDIRDETRMLMPRRRDMRAIQDLNNMRVLLRKYAK